MPSDDDLITRESMNTATYTPEVDITEPYNDGSGIKVLFKAGQPIEWATAHMLGLVSTEQPPVETFKRKPIKPDVITDHD